MAQKTTPNWVEIGTLIVAFVTLIVSGLAASFAWRLDNVERQLLEFQARSEVLYRLIIVEASSSCDLENRLFVQQNQVWTEFLADHCSDIDINSEELQIAGLALEPTGASRRVFVPRPNIGVQQVNVTETVELSDVEFLADAAETEEQRLGFLQDGEARDIFIPLAAIAKDGTVASNIVIRPVYLNWNSPVSGDNVVVDLEWFAPREQWLALDGLFWGL